LKKSIISLQLIQETRIHFLSGHPRVFIRVTMEEINWIKGGITRDISFLVADPNSASTLYAGKENEGLYESLDGGETWRKILGSSFDGREIVIDPVNPSIFYAVTGDLRISTDRGRHWKTLFHPHNTDIFSFSMDRVTPTNLYVGTSSGVYKSKDGGGEWIPYNTGLTAIPVFSVVLDPMTATTLYAVADSGIIKSEDGGSEWKTISTELNRSELWRSYLLIDPKNPTTLYLKPNGYTSWLYKSMDGGLDWERKDIDFGIVVETVIDPNTSITLYALINNQWRNDPADYSLFKSVDGGNQWNVIYISPSDTYIHNLVIDPKTPTTLYMEGSAGVLKSTDGGVTWIRVNNGLTDISLESMCIDPMAPENIYVVTHAGDLFKSTNGGGSWNRASTNLPQQVMHGIQMIIIDP
jgi:photosystem II stability/assembly factor-like uncharacterized protein